MPIAYADASALVKLVRDEPESEALRSYLAFVGIVTCELALTEVPRAVRRAAADDPRLPLDRLLDRAGAVLESVGLVPLDRGILLAAGAIVEPGIRTLDAIHVAAAVSLGTVDAFVTYDERQAAVARLSGLRVPELRVTR